MKIGFDLDGTLDRPAVRELAFQLLEAGVEVHIISGYFAEGEWQHPKAKYAKLVRMGFGHWNWINEFFVPECQHLVVSFIDQPDTERDTEYRLRNIALRKGAYCEEHGIDIMFDDSELYVKLMPAFCGTQMVHVK